MPPKPRLVDALKSSYGERSGEARLHAAGYLKDEALSSKHQSIYYSPKDSHLLVNVRGTQEVSDLIPDTAILLGRLKETRRFKEAQEAHDRAVAKYHPRNVTVTGHSLGGSIASELATAPETKKVTFNKGVSPFVSKPNAKGEKAYRTALDPISVFAAGKKGTKTVGAIRINPFAAHSYKSLQKSKIYI